MTSAISGSSAALARCGVVMRHSAQGARRAPVRTRPSEAPPVEPALTGVVIGDPTGLWYRVVSSHGREVHADMSRISQGGVADFRPVEPLIGDPLDRLESIFAKA